MKKLTLDMCHVQAKIRRVGEEKFSDLYHPSDRELKEYPEKSTVAMVVSFLGYSATSVRIPYQDLTEEKKQYLSESALIVMIKDMREARDLLSQYDLSNE